MTEMLKITSENYEQLKYKLKPHLKENCKYCNIKIDKETFGYLSREITCCRNMICISQAVGEKICQNYNQYYQGKEIKKDLLKE